MPTNLALNDKLIQRVLKLGGHRTKREAVNTALEEYLCLLQRRQFFAMAGTLPELPADQKTLRHSDRKRLPQDAKAVQKPALARRAS